MAGHGKLLIYFIRILFLLTCAWAILLLQFINFSNNRPNKFFSVNSNSRENFNLGEKTHSLFKILSARNNSHKLQSKIISDVYKNSEEILRNGVVHSSEYSTISATGSNKYSLVTETGINDQKDENYRLKTISSREQRKQIHVWKHSVSDVRYAISTIGEPLIILPPSRKNFTAKIQDVSNYSWNPENLMNKISKPGTRCRRLLRMGGSLSCGAMDGHKFVCFDPDVAPKPYIIANKIILESFTINESAPAVALTKPMSDSEEVFWEIYSQNFDTEHKKEDYPMFRITSPEFNIENLQNTSNQQHLNKTSRTKNDRIPNKEPKFDTLFKKPPKTNINYTRNSYIHFLPSRPMDKLCNVYSFGIGSDTTFDYALQHFGCKVFSFDMTIVNSTNTHVTPSWNFLTLGISNESVVLDMTMRPSGNTIVATLRTLEEIQEIFDRSDSTIDILKLDVEDNEWKIFDQLLQHEEGRRLLSRVNQMQLEIHLEKLLNDTESVRVQAGQYYESVLDSLHGLGFRLVHTFLNQFSQKYVDIRGHVIPIYRESLYIRRP